MKRPLLLLSSYITLVNPFRIAPYTTNPLASFTSQYSVTASSRLPATWLLSYDVLLRPELVAYAKSLAPSQELGLLLEVSPALAKAARVTYPATASWHFANAIFLSGYSQSDRLKLLNTLFATFHSEFGYYPSSVGSWWTDSFSQSYLQRKYHITANLTVSDQFSTDGYQVWGQPWSVPFYPSSHHAGMPGDLKVVNLQWAPRDPLNGYFNSLYSTQDFFTTPEHLTFDYLKKLIALYPQVTLGLETDLDPAAYAKIYASTLQYLTTLPPTVHITSMRDYAQRFPGNAATFISTSDLLGSPKQVFWYTSGHFRLGLAYDATAHQVHILDLRVYPSNFTEPYYTSPNALRDLQINVPSVVDTVSKPALDWTFSADLLKQTPTSLVFSTGSINLSEDKLTFTDIAIPEFVTTSPLIQVQGTALVPADYPYSDTGLILHPLWRQVPYALRSRLGRLSSPQAQAFIFGSLTVVCLLLFLSQFKFKRKLAILTFVPLLVWSVSYQPASFYVSQSELESLRYLSLLPPGTVLTLDKDCLKCTFQTVHKPAASANYHSYVGQISNHPTVSTMDLMFSPTVTDLKNLLHNQHITYIYLAKYENYIEDTRFAPTDLGLTKIWDSANSQIWQVN